MLKPGDTFERYTIDAAIGQGGMGCVYRAHDTRLDRRVALKVISDGVDGAEREDADARLVREARAAAALDHPNAIAIYDVGSIDGAPYIVMELVSGRTLREVIADGGASVTTGGAPVPPVTTGGAPVLPVDTRVAWLADIARALGAAHRRGLVHRDIKPENVMVRDDGVVKVLDFGIARRTAAVDASAPTQSPALPTLTKEGVKMGTPTYMAPEAIRGDPLDGRADQFSWGVLAYELLAGQLPWRRAGDPLAAVASILTDDVPREPLDRAGVPPEVARVVLRALEKKPDARFASMDDLARALDELRSAGPPRPSAAPRAEAPGPSARESSRAPISPARAPSPPLPASTTQLQRFSTGEVREILARAVEQQEAERSDARLGFDDLLAAAREVGVQPDVLREASRELRAKQVAQANDGAARDAWIRKKRRGFYRHLGIWVIVNVAFVLIGLVDGGGSNPTQFFVPGILWGIWLAIQGLRAFTAHEDEWREELEKEARKAQKERQKERQKQRRGQAVDRAIEEGAAVLLQRGALLRQRIAEPGDAGAPRVRVASGGSATGEHDAAAEEEAASAEHERAARRGR